MKRPAFQFYPADWRKDAALQSCSLAARGLWIEAMCIAHECEPYGHLVVNGKAMTTAQFSRLVGLTERECARLLAELDDAGVLSRLANGTIFSRRMVRDEQFRQTRSECGKLGGNPALKLGPELKVEDKVGGKLRPKLEPTPSSSSSSSTSVSPPLPSGRDTPPSSPPAPTAPSPKAKAPKPEGQGNSAHGSRLPADWKLPDEWAEFARAERPDWDDAHLLRVSLEFRDYWHAKAGQDARKADWTATWRNWVRREDSAPRINGHAKGREPEWWASEAGTLAKARELGLSSRGGESWHDFRQRIRTALGARH